jgi:hypothetical protein
MLFTFVPWGTVETPRSLRGPHITLGLATAPLRRLGATTVASVASVASVATGAWVSERLRTQNLLHRGELRPSGCFDALA